MTYIFAVAFLQYLLEYNFEQDSFQTVTEDLKMNFEKTRSSLLMVITC